MALSFTFAVDKMQAPAIGRAEGHNLRLHATESQLRPEAWFTPEGRHQVKPWRPEALVKSKGLAKRKDAVQAIQFVIQLGNQTDWRDEPEPDFPEGRPLNIADQINLAARGIKAWAAQEFGEENIVGIDLHTDESSPHFHVVVTPIKNGKLQAKAWLDGPTKLAALRKRAWQAVNAHIKCEYTPGAPGGAPHDPRKAAGQTPAPTLLDKISGHAKAQKLERENAALREENAQLKQVLFSRQKGRYSADNVELAQQAATAAQKAQSELQRAQGEVRRLTMDLDNAQSAISRQGGEIDKLKGYNRTLAEQNNKLEEKLQELQPNKSRGMGMGR
ncbi:plasmid recombination protein [Aeromonas sp. sif2416]|uniref:plasmid recombination protein n=1 Tax=Aeromonas sp. sif2416 TaxID=2854793 RepID=UPI001C450D0C|nr:plasmid recombination protein [Aeromonas sp. sif2416]MBV7439742.1 plasmid recombination protein [Aeromonas sp. sif2416]